METNGYRPQRPDNVRMVRGPASSDDTVVLQPVRPGVARIAPGAQPAAQPEHRVRIVVGLRQSHAGRPCAGQSAGSAATQAALIAFTAATLVLAVIVTLLVIT